MATTNLIRGFPLPDGEYKIVQLTVRGQPVLLAGFASGCYHADLLEEALTTHQIQPSIVGDYRGQRVIATNGAEYAVEGMGRLSVTNATKTAIFFGTSHAYGLGPSQASVRELQTQHPAWQIEFRQ